MTRPLYPARDTMRAAIGIAAAKLIGALIITACFLGPDAIVAWVMG